MPPEIWNARIEMPNCSSRKAPAKIKNISTPNEIRTASSAILRCVRGSSVPASDRKTGSAPIGLMIRSRVTNSLSFCCHHIGRPQSRGDVPLFVEHCEAVAADWLTLRGVGLASKDAIV